MNYIFQKQRNINKMKSLSSYEKSLPGDESEGSDRDTDPDTTGNVLIQTDRMQLIHAKSLTIHPLMLVSLIITYLKTNRHGS
jgi:hypothetical protein